MIYRPNKEVKIISGAFKNIITTIIKRRNDYYFIKETKKNSKQKDKYIKIHESNLVAI